MNTGMNGCLRMTKGSGYALKAMAGLAIEAPDRPVAIKALARSEGIPPSFLAKILRPLIRARLVSAKAGAGGGVLLARKAGEISVLKILEAYEGTYERDACIFYSATRCNGRDCPVYCLFRREEDRIRTALATATLADLAGLVEHHPERSNRNGKGGGGARQASPVALAAALAPRISSTD